MEDKKPTEEQIKLIQMVANGVNQGLIAAAMGVKRRTVEDRLKKMRRNLGSVSLHRVCLEYYKNGWIK